MLSSSPWAPPETLPSASSFRALCCGVVEVRQIKTATYLLVLLVGDVAHVVNDLLGGVLHVEIVQLVIILYFS